jgi:TPR repeat protein
VQLLSATAALTLTDWSESTLRRRWAEGLIGRVTEDGGAGRAMVPWDDLQPHLAVTLAPSELPMLWAADAGDPEAQVDLALLLIEQGFPKGARAWLQLAIRRDHPEAAYWLARLDLAGEGGLANDATALAWLARAAELGHPIAQAQIRELAGRPPSPVQPLLEHQPRVLP